MSDTPPNDSGSLRVNMKDVYALVQGVQTDVAEIKSSLALATHIATDGRADVVDHEERLRKLEQWKYAIPTTFVLSFFSALSTIIIAVVVG